MMEKRKDAGMVGREWELDAVTIHDGRICESQEAGTMMPSMFAVSAKYFAVMTHASIRPLLRAQLGIGNERVRLITGAKDCGDPRHGLGSALA